jgi:hypothetical protein
MLFKERITLYSKNLTKHINAPYRKNAELFLMLIQVADIIIHCILKG